MGIETNRPFKLVQLLNNLLRGTEGSALPEAVMVSVAPSARNTHESVVFKHLIIF